MVGLNYFNEYIKINFLKFKLRSLCKKEGTMKIEPFEKLKAQYLVVYVLHKLIQCFVTNLCFSLGVCTFFPFYFLKMTVIFFGIRS